MAVQANRRATLDVARTLTCVSSSHRLLMLMCRKSSPVGLTNINPLCFHVPTYAPYTVPTASCLTGMM